MFWKKNNANDANEWTGLDLGENWGSLGNIKQGRFYREPEEIGDLEPTIGGVVLHISWALETKENITIWTNIEYDSKIEALERKLKDEKYKRELIQKELDAANETMIWAHERVQHLEQELQNEAVKRSEEASRTYDTIDIVEWDDIESEIRESEKEILEIRERIFQLRWEQRLKRAQENLQEASNNHKAISESLKLADLAVTQAEGSLNTFSKDFKDRKKAEVEQARETLAAHQDALREVETAQRILKDADSIPSDEDDLLESIKDIIA